MHIVRYIFGNREAGQNLAKATILSFGIALALLILSIPDASADPFTTSDPDKDFNTLGLAGQNKNPVGLCAVKHPTNGKTYMLVSDSRDRKIYAYDLNSTNKARLDSHHTPDDDFKLSSTDGDPASINGFPTGIWSDGTTLWVAEGIPYVRDDNGEDAHFNRDIESHRNKLKRAKIFTYTLSWTNVTWTNSSGVTQTSNGVLRGDRDTSKEFWLYTNGETNKTISYRNNESNISPTGLWSDGKTMWVANSGEDRIFAYDLRTGAHDATKGIDLGADNTYAQGIWSDGETMWVSDFAGKDADDEKKIFAYNMWTNSPTGVKMFDGSRASKDFDTLKDAGNERPRGIWSDVETMWVADKIDNKLYAYHAFRSTTSRNLNAEFDSLKDAGNNTPRGIWSDGETMWVTDDSNDKLYAYNLATKKRVAGKGFTLKERESDDKFPQSLWSDGETMWVAHFKWIGTESKLFAYDLDSKARDADEDFDTLLTAGNQNPVGLWSNDTTMWVADSQDGKIYAYKMSDKSRDEGKDFDTLEAAGNTNPKGIYSDGTTMWVADSDDDKIYAYKMSDKTRDAGKDFDTLKDAGNNAPFGIWSDGTTTMWVLDSQDGKIYAYPLSDAARLGKLELKGHIPSRQNGDFKVQLEFNNMPIPSFNSGTTTNIPSFNSGTTTNYTASVPFATSHLTVSPKTLRPNDTTATSHRVNLIVGDNPISITVTNGQATGLPRTRTYEVTVKREFFTYNDPSKNVALSASWMPTNAVVRGLWTDDTTMWLSARETMQDQNIETFSGKLYSYDLQSTNLVVSTNNLTHNNPYGIWANGTTMWIADSDDDKLYAYDLASKQRDSSKDFNTLRAAGNNNPQWIWSDGATMWVTDDDKIFAYKMSGDKERDESREIDLGELVKDNKDHKGGIWSDGANLWVANTNNAKIYSYKLAGNRIDCREETKDFNTLEGVGNHNPKAIFSDGSIMYVADNTTFTNVANGSTYKKIFAYNQPLSGNAWLKTLTLSGDVYYGTKDFKLSNPTTHYNTWVDRATATTTIIAEAQDSNAVSVKITPEDADSNTSGHQISLSAGKNEIKITVTAENGVIDNLYTINIHRINNDGRIPPLDFELKGGNADPTGIWADGETMWVVDNSDKAVYAYKMSGKEWAIQNDDKTFPFSTQSLQGAGIWSDGTTMWVSDQQINKLFAYQNEESADGIFGNPDVAGDFTTLRSDNVLSPRGLWGDDETLWVANKKNKLFAYTLANENRDSNKDVTLSDIDGNSGAPSIWDFWANESTIYIINNNGKSELPAYQRKVKENGKLVRDSGKDITLSTDNGNPKGIWSNGTVIWVSDETADKIFAYRMPTASGATGGSDFFFSEDSTLSGSTLTPAFSADNLYYTANVDPTVHSTTVTASPNDSGSAVIIFSGARGTTRVTARKGPQVSLEEGYNIIAIDVLAESRTAQSTYIIEVTKAAKAPPTSGGPLPVFQSASVGDNPSASSSSGIGEWKSRLISTETLPDGGVRFVFAVPAGEFRIEETPDLLGETWRPLSEEEAQILRESNGDGQDRLTIILPKVGGKQRFLRLTPLATRKP